MLDDYFWITNATPAHPKAIGWCAITPENAVPPVRCEGDPDREDLVFDNTGPKLLPVQPKLLPDKPKLLLEQPKTLPVQPKLHLVQPKCLSVQPKLLLVQPKCLPVQPKLLLVQPK